jgi:hypothetical protein
MTYIKDRALVDGMPEQLNIPLSILQGTLKVGGGSLTVRLDMGLYVSLDCNQKDLG